MDWNAFLSDTVNRIGTLEKQATGMFDGFATMSRATKRNGALDEKTKELIATGIAIALRCDGCIGFHTKALQKLGTTCAEFEEMLAVAIYMGGGPSLMYAAQAMDAWDQFGGDR